MFCNLTVLTSLGHLCLFYLLFSGNRLLLLEWVGGVALGNFSFFCSTLWVVGVTKTLQCWYFLAIKLSLLFLLFILCVIDNWYPHYFISLNSGRYLELGV